MAPLNLEGDNLGEKHRLFNQLVKNDVANKKFEPSLTEDDDLQNLLTIEVAAANRNVDFILEVVKGEDMLYVSRALNRSTWLITDNQYVHIINPEYLYNKLFPHMTAKAIKKLLLSIRLHLKDETRVEEFYNYIINKDNNEAFKWLQHCSVPFVEKEIRKHCNEIPHKTLSRLLGKSFLFVEAAISETNHHKSFIISCSESIAGQDPEKYLDIIEKFDLSKCVTFKPKTTAHIMSRCPERIIENFENYYDAVDVATFVSFLRKTKKVEDFLIEQTKNNKINQLYRDNYLEHWLKYIPRENRIGLIKHLKSIIKETKDDSYFGYGIFYQPNLFYKIYKLAPFDVALTELRKNIHVESKPRNRNEILLILLSNASKNIEYIRTLLQYYFKNHFNEPRQFKIEFLNAFLSETESNDFDEEMWNILNKLFHSLEIYTESENNAQSCIQAIIVRNIVHGTNIPDIVQTKFVFDTLKPYEKKLNTQKDKDAVFCYLYNYVLKKIDKNTMESDLDFSECITDINKLLTLLKDWKKDINQYPEIVSKIKQLIVTNNEKHYEADLTSFYNINKKWRRTIFEESILLAPSDTTCLNVIKHDFSVMERSMEYLLKIFFNDKISVIDTLKKIRIYWPAKAKELKDIYLSRTDGADNFRALVTGLCVLLPQKELKVFVENYAPTSEKLDWNDTEEHVYFLRKNIAIRIHRARPLVPIELILLFAKGDYLQYTVPSLCATLHQFSYTKSKQRMSKILDAPVSLQKLGIRYACCKLETDDLLTVFPQIWSSKNPTIRTVVLTNIHKRLCQEKVEFNIKNLWKTMSDFIDDLTSEENGIIYSKLSVSQDIPMTIKVEYFQKVYKFLTSLSQPKFNRDSMLMRMKNNSCEFMDKLDDNFVADYILGDLWDKMIKNKYFFWNEDCHLATYLLRNKDEDTQVRRYNIFFNPFLGKCLLQWTEKHEIKYSVIDKTRELLRKLIRSLKNITINDKMAIPLKLFQNIQTQLENHLSYEKNYKLLTYWKLATEMIRLFDKNKQILESTADINDLCIEINKKIAPSFAKFCVEIVKEDVNRFSSWIHKLFTATLEDLFWDLNEVFVSTPNQLEYFKYMLECEQNREVYLTVIPLIERLYGSCYDNKHNKPVEKSVLIEIQHLLYFYPTEEIKMHYYDLISNSQFLV